MKSFLLDTGLACQYGVDEAIFLQTIGYWIEKNHANGVNRVAGRTWTYNSLPALAKMFPFWSTRVLERIIGHLTEAGAVITAEHSRGSRVKWYALSDDVLCAFGLDDCMSDAAESTEDAASALQNCSEEPISPNGEIAQTISPNGENHLTKRGDVICNNNNTTNTPKAPKRGDRDPDDYPDEFEEFWAAYPRKTDKRRAFRAWRKAKLTRADLPDILSSLKAWMQCDQWQDPRFIPHPTTWLNNRRWESSPNIAAEQPIENGGFDIWTA